VSIAVSAEAGVHHDVGGSTASKVAVDGKFLRAGHDRFLVKGVAYGTFAPDANGLQFPPLTTVADDFRAMAGLGINTVRLYTLPDRALLDEAARCDLRVMLGVPWAQHVAFLDDRRMRRGIRRQVSDALRELGDHPAVLMCAVGNEIPANLVRWHGRLRIERFLRQLYQEAKEASPDSLLTYVNFPPTEFLDLSFFDVCAFNVYLHEAPALRAYLARLQHIAGHRPLLLAEGGACSLREGDEGQAEITGSQLRSAFREGACGAITFTWTDDWWRGGHPVMDWAFGLVDRDRRPKPAAAAVAAAFENAPFSAADQTRWPRVSVVVCAHNAEKTLEDCLGAIERLTYPHYEIILVNDGSHDRTAEIARRFARVRVIDVPNGGLASARNVGLAEASGDIVAYTDADTRVDRDWLTYLVQPFLTSDVVGAGGPNVVPPDDPPMAQCIARAPGAPTHVLLDDRIAEHVPGCNMAFRRDALLAIGGFSPTYLRAGDDVDVCWRLQARGWKIGFASAALVWHHHRTSTASYWRQQVGYGEGERWLMAHHPDKFLGGRMVWHGRIYSPLPFVRSLWGERVNAGVWGLSAFPSVYRTDAHPFAFLPHSVRWQALSILLIAAGAVVVALGRDPWAATLLIGSGLAGLVATITKNVAYAIRSDVHAFSTHRVWHRAVVAYLHFVQPFARVVGQARAILSPPDVILPAGAPTIRKGPGPSLKDLRRALSLLSGNVVEDRFWSDTWTDTEQVLSRLTDWLRRSRAVPLVEIDEGWSVDRDLSVPFGWWGWLDIRALVEDHGAGRVLLRLGAHIRPTSLGVATGLSLGALLLTGAVAGAVIGWPLAGALSSIGTVAVTFITMWRTAATLAVLDRAVHAVGTELGLSVLTTTPTGGPLVPPAFIRTFGLRAAVALIVLVVATSVLAFVPRETAAIVVIGDEMGYAGDGGPATDASLDAPGGLAITSDGEVYLADSNNHVIRRIHASGTIETVAGNHALGAGFSGDYGLAAQVQFNTPADVALAPDGDLLVVDSHNHRVRRIDRPTGTVTTVAGSNRAGYAGDGGPASSAALYWPSAVAAAANGDIYIADTLNYRVRMIDHVTGLIHTVAGDGSLAEDFEVGDNGPATAAKLNMPSDVAIAPNGDLYIADMHHQRIRRVDARTRRISTVAGNGQWGQTGDGGLAIAATLAGPSGIALVAGERDALTIFIVDHYNAMVRAITPDGIIHDVGSGGLETFTEPTRVAFSPRRGWLYVTDPGRNRLVVLDLPRLAPEIAAVLAAPAPRAGGAGE